MLIKMIIICFMFNIVMEGLLLKAYNAILWQEMALCVCVCAAINEILKPPQKRWWSHLKKLQKWEKKEEVSLISKSYTFNMRGSQYQNLDSHAPYFSHTTFKGQTVFQELRLPVTLCCIMEGGLTVSGRFWTWVVMNGTRHHPCRFSPVPLLLFGWEACRCIAATSYWLLCFKSVFQPKLHCCWIQLS